MEWTREKTLALINEYRKRRELWDMTHEDYRKKEMKQRFLHEVSKNLGGISISEIEKKFHTLRTQYHREINRIKRKESYNSKWFGFKQLQFLSSPKACRSSKGRIKAEITEDGTVTTKYIINEHVADSSAVSVNSSSSTIADEFLTIHRKPANITYEESRGNGTTASRATSSPNSRSKELEKLIEETTKDVDYIDEPKPKLTIKELRAPMEAQSYDTSGEDMETETHDEQQLQHEHDSQQQQHHHHQNENVNPLEIEIQNSDGEIITNHYHQTGNAETTTTTTTIHNLPRIIKIQRRDTIAAQDDEYYHHHQQQPAQQHQETHILPHSIPQTAKRIFYGTNGQHTATILTPTTTPPTQQPSGNGRTTILPPPSSSQSSEAPSPQQQQQQQQQLTPRDEYTTYGEYVANEMRNLTNREVLVALKHKINNALFEASMAELQK